MYNAKCITSKYAAGQRGETAMDYREKAIHCLKDTSLPVLMQWSHDCGGEMDRYCEKYGDSEFSFAKVIEPGRVYEMGYPRCVCPGAAGGADDPHFCECSRQGVLFVLEAMMPGRPIEVTTIETVLRGGEKCRFLVTVGPVPR